MTVKTMWRSHIRDFSISFCCYTANKKETNGKNFIQIGDDWMEAVVFDRENMQMMKDVDIRTVERSQLVDLKSVVIDENQPIAERMEAFVRQIRNPYCFRVGDVAVKVVYKENGPTFQQNFEEMLLSM